MQIFGVIFQSIKISGRAPYNSCCNNKKLVPDAGEANIKARINEGTDS